MENKFDPKKNYTWSPESKFELSGITYGKIRKLVEMIVNSPEAVKVLTALDLGKDLQDLFEKSVEEGLIKEMPNQKYEK